MEGIDLELTPLDYGRLPDNLTPLYALPVVNAGTDLTQALSSYVVMLAARHRLSLKTLLKFISEYCGKRGIPSPTTKYIETTRLDAGGSYAALLVNVLWTLTGTSVSGCCWLKLQTAFAGNFQGIVRATRQWCIPCYRESRERYGIVYEPLIWSYPGATACPVHHAKYESTCPGCGQRQPLMGAQLDHWHCNYCKTELAGIASKPNIRLDSRIIGWNDWLHRELGLLVSSLWDQTFVPDPANFRQFVSLLAKDDPRGYRGLSMRTNIEENTLSQWVRRSPPAFDLFIRFCASLGSSPLTVLTTPSDAVHEVSKWAAPIPIEPRQKKLNVTTNDWPRIQQELRRIIAQDTAIPALDQICKRLGVAEGTLRSREGILLKQLQLKRLREKARARSLARSDLIRLGTRIFREMRKERRHLSRRTFERELMGRSGCGYRTARAVYSQLYRSS